ncbi:hypothetical protein TNIN_72671 [Trichonephila inaurata madagascariensis]|uniref:Uncharacterized protein n=1 Tax=Trichonephila inaurata madagascariensis TaxID=2747483 RepID=A0A8X7BVL6_9ARAC|nr:hypothetical protein TNIN_72671 [Trichonephila inaurata madagascariensis]
MAPFSVVSTCKTHIESSNPTNRTRGSVYVYSGRQSHQNSLWNWRKHSNSSRRYGKPPALLLSDCSLSSRPDNRSWNLSHRLSLPGASTLRKTLRLVMT